MRRSILGVLVTMGCASAQTSGSPGTAVHPASVQGDETVLVRLSEEPDAMMATIKADPQKVWSALPTVYGELGVTNAQVLDSERQVYGTRDFTASQLAGTRTGDFVRCGEEGAGVSLGNLMRRKLSIVTTVRGDASGKTTISTEISGYAQPVEGTSTSAMRCASNGKFEKRIRSLMIELVGNP